MFDWGIQVVCINDNWPPDHGLGIKKPIKDQVLTIRDIHTFDHTLELGLLFEEIVNQPLVFNGVKDPLEVCWPSKAFRPVKKTNIDDLIKLTKGQPKRKKLAKDAILEDA